MALATNGSTTLEYVGLGGEGLACVAGAEPPPPPPHEAKKERLSKSPMVRVSDKVEIRLLDN
jgi:hypothetical protein